jgi:division protein CdvB (Snf7/Vps24/ESCRT-III family)
MKNDLTVRILAEIRDSVRETNTRLDDTNARLEQMREELSRRIVSSEIRTATALTELAHSVRDVTALLREQHDLRPRVDKCEVEIAELKRRVPAPR